MNKVLFSLLLTVFAVAAQAGNPGDGDKVKVSPTQSKIEWTARKVTGKHNGTIAIKEGNLDIKNGQLKGGSFVIDMPTITVTDLQGKGKENLEGHLKSDDFFGVATHPTASFVITSAKHISDNNYNVKGDLTIKGVKNPIEFTALLLPSGTTYTATANIKVDRTLYDVKYGSGKFFQDLGDKAIFDEFELAVTLVSE